MALVGNKSDLGDRRRVSAAEGTALAHKYSVPVFLECSAKTGHNCDRVFTEIGWTAVCKMKSFLPRLAVTREAFALLIWQLLGRGLHEKHMMAIYRFVGPVSKLLSLVYGQAPPLFN